MASDTQQLTATEWHQRGVAAVQAEEFVAAAECFKAAADLESDSAIYLTDWGRALWRLGRLSEAVQYFRAAVAAKPGWAPAHLALGIALEQQGDTSGAMEQYRQALAAKPHAVDPRCRLAALLAATGRTQEAAEHYEQAAGYAPDDYHVQINWGAALQDLGELDRAAQCYERALAIDQSRHEALVNLASIHTRRREFDAAADRLRRAVSLYPDNADLRVWLAEALDKIGAADEARSQLSAAARIEPSSDLRRLRLALRGPTVFEDDRQIDDWQRELLSRLIEFRGQRLHIDVDQLTQHGCQPPLSLIYQGRDDLPIRRELANIFACSLPTESPPQPEGKPSVGFFVPKGSEGIFLRGMAGVLTRLSPQRFRTVVIGHPPGLAAIRTALGDAATDYAPIDGRLTHVVEQVRSMRLHMIYYWEVGTDALSYFLPFFRPAAVQCTSWGWPVTSGIPAMDFFISSRWLEVDGAAAHYSERLITLDNIPNYYARPPDDAVCPSKQGRERLGIADASRLYLCPQNPAKIQPAFDDLAAGILQADPLGVLVIIASRAPYVSQAIRERIARRFPDCAGRIVIAPRMTQGEYRQLSAAADVVLDTVGYSGGANSTYDALWAGVPVVTLPTVLHRGRYTAAALRIIGLEECVAATPDQYVATAVSLATDRDRRQAVISRILERRDVLFDNVAAVRELEETFERLIADANCAG